MLGLRYTLASSALSARSVRSSVPAAEGVFALARDHTVDEPAPAGTDVSISTSMPAARASWKSARRASAPVRSIRPSPSRWTASRVASGCSRQQSAGRRPVSGPRCRNRGRREGAYGAFRPRASSAPRGGARARGERRPRTRCPRSRPARCGARARASGRTSTAPRAPWGLESCQSRYRGAILTRLAAATITTAASIACGSGSSTEAAGKKASTTRPVTIALNDVRAPGEAVDRAAGEGAADRKAAGDRSRHVGHALADELAVRVPGAALERGVRARDRRRLREADQSDHGAGNEERRKVGPRQVEREGRKPAEMDPHGAPSKSVN